jgi:hypothetical protein
MSIYRHLNIHLTVGPYAYFFYGLNLLLLVSFSKRYSQSLTSMYDIFFEEYIRVKNNERYVGVTLGKKEEYLDRSVDEPLTTACR